MLLITYKETGRVDLITKTVIDSLSLLRPRTQTRQIALVLELFKFQMNKVRAGASDLDLKI